MGVAAMVAQMQFSFYKVPIFNLYSLWIQMNKIIHLKKAMTKIKR
jgi:hypothetical protein